MYNNVNKSHKQGETRLIQIQNIVLRNSCYHRYDTIYSDKKREKKGFVFNIQESKTAYCI